MKAIFDVQVSERDSWGIPRLRTYGTTASRYHVSLMLADIRNLSSTRRLSRVLRDGRVISERETRDLDK